MKKVMKFFCFFLLLGCVFIGLTSCGKDDSKKQEPQYEIFLLATESGFTGTYEEWLDSIRGVDGKSVELQVVNGKICWRYANATSWIELITIEELVGSNGVTPHIGQNGNWFIGAEDTGVKAEGSNGVNGLNPHIGENGNWFIGTIDTNIKAEGADGANGVTPHIGENGNWFIGTEDTGIKAEGADGANGVTPHIGENGNWFIGTEDTGIKAEGSNGANGVTPHIGENGNWFIGTTDTGISAGFKDKYTITFNVNGGILPDNTSSTLENISHGQVISSLPIPTRAGYNFIGWYTGMTVNDGQFYNYMPVCCNLNLVARWERQFIKVAVEVVNYNTMEVTVPQGTTALDLEGMDEFQDLYLLEIRNAVNEELIEPDFILESGMHLVVTEFVSRQEFLNGNFHILRESLYHKLKDLPQEIFDILSDNLQEEFYDYEMNHVEVLDLVSQKEVWISEIVPEEILKSHLEGLFMSCAIILQDEYINDIQILYEEALENMRVATNVDEKTHILYQYRDALSEKAYSTFDSTKVIKQRYMYYFKQGIYGLIGENMYDMAKIDLILDEMTHQLEEAITSEDVFLIGTNAISSIKELPVKSGISVKDLKQIISESIDVLENKEFYVQEIEEFRSRLLDETDKKELCSIYLDVIDFIFQKGWKLIYAFGEYSIEGIYMRKASTATDLSAGLLEEVYTKYKEIIMSIEFIDIFECSDLIATRFFQIYNAELEAVYIEDEVKMLAVAKAEATNLLNREVEYFSNAYNEYLDQIMNLQTEIELEISNALTLEDLMTIKDSISERLYKLIENMRQ